jgi:glycosyltransferase involved in cell wall biosynthesis
MRELEPVATTDLGLRAASASQSNVLCNRIIFFSILDFPNGMGNTMRIKMIGKAFLSIGYKVSLLLAYAPGTIGAGINQTAEGEFEGIEFKYCNGSPAPPAGYIALFFLKTIGLLRVLIEAWKQSKISEVKFIYLYGTHGTIFYEDLAYWLLARFIGAKVILDVNDARQEGAPVRSGSEWFRFWLRRIKYLLIRLKGNFTVSKADYLFFVSNYLKESVETKKKPSAKMLFVPMLIDSTAVQGLRRQRIEERKIIGYAGFFKEYEGLDFLLEALTELAKTFPQFECHLYGGTQSNAVMTKNLQRMIVESGLKERVFIKRSVSHDELFQVLANCDVLVVPRRTSIITMAGFSQKFGDYLLSGAPAVSTAVGEAVCLLENGKHIVFTPEGDAAAFAAAIRELFLNEEKAKTIGLNGRNYVMENFDYRVVARQIQAMLVS